jgi:hypothetical protein
VKTNKNNLNGTKHQKKRNGRRIHIGTSFLRQKATTQSQSPKEDKTNRQYQETIQRDKDKETRYRGKTKRRDKKTRKKD